MSAIEQRRAQLLAMCEWLRRDLERRSLGTEAEQRVTWYLVRAVEALDCAIAEAANGSLRKTG
jgi:hypothetical protein